MSIRQLLLLFFLCNSIAANASKVDTLVLQSTFLKKATKFVVIQPNLLNNRLDTYPVVYLLHGHGGNYAQWSSIAPQLPEMANALNMIFVCPDGGVNSWYFDSPMDSTIRYESYITKELIPYIDAHFPTKATANTRAITGLSMGGHGAMYLAIKHTNLFGAAGSMSGGVDFTPFPNNWNLSSVLGKYDSHKENWEQHTVLHQVETLHNTHLAIIFDCGVDDFFLKVNRALHDKLLALKISHDYIERPGKHNSEYWKNSIDFQLLYFKHFFQMSS